MLKVRVPSYSRVSRGLLATLVAFMIWSLAGATLAADTLDQSQTGTANYLDAGHIEGIAKIANEFTPSLSGSLTRIEVYLVPSGIARSVTMTVRSGAPNGTGTDLATKTITTGTASGWYEFLFAQPVTVTAGQKYSFTLSSTTTQAGLHAGYLITSPPSGPYGGGQNYIYDQNGTWTEWNDADVAFKTYWSPNAAPAVGTNSALSLPEGGTGTVSNSQLQATDADNPAASTLVFTVGTAPANGSLRKSGSPLAAGGTFTQSDIDSGLITYVHNNSETTSDSFTFTLSDGLGGTAGPATFTLNVLPVNDAPSFTKGADQAVSEDSGAQSVAGWATAMSAGEAGQTVSFAVTNSNNALFSSQPAVAADGTLTYTPAANANGSATVTVTLSDNGGTANGGVDSFSQTFTITVNAVNDPPAFTKGADQSVGEDAGAQSVANWATGVSAGPANEAGQTLTFTVTNNNNGLFSAQPAVSSNGTLTYTTAANSYGSATVTVTLSDGAGGTTTAQTFTIDVAAVNDAPSFTKGADQGVAEDAGAQSVANWATNMSAGPPDEGAQTLSFAVSNNNNGLFSSQPAISAAGELTYTPAADANGTATVTVTLSDNGGGANTFAQTFTITVTAVNDAPSFTKGADATVAEDAGAQTVANWATGISAGPANEATQTLTFTITNSNNALFSAQPAIDSSGALTYTPAANASGTATATVTLSDGTDTTAEQTFTITVTAVNDAPSFTKGADQSVTEDAGAQSVANWATGISAGGDDEAAQTLTFTVTNSNNALFSAQPAISSSGALTYTPAADASGTATVTVTLSDGVDTAAAQTFTIAVTAVNDVPSFTKGANETILEDAGAQSVAAWATGMSPGPAGEAAQSLSFNVTTTNNSLFSALPAIDAATGDLTYTPAANANGTATVTVTLSDNGGTAGGGADTSAPQTFTITVTAVNDAPAFTKGADQSVNEDAGAQGVANWATGISAGPADELGQTLAFTVTNDNNGLFSDQPVVSPIGELVYTPAANANGSATVTVTLSDGAGGTTTAQSFTINVAAVNDAPSFTKGADQSVAEDAGAQSIAAWATSISAGPANEGAQTLSFAVTNTNNGLFSSQPAIAPNGTLTYTPAADANGTATVTVTLSDNGGGTNTFADTFTITVAAVNDVPSFTKGADETVAEDAGAQSVANWATGISAGPANESGQTLTFALSTDNNGLFSVLPAISSSGSLTYTPAANASGTATVTVTLSDGADTTAAQMFTINVTAVNDPPAFTKGADQSVTEDAGAQSVANWATGISAGAANEAAQTLTFTVTNNNNGLFSAQPAISSGGTLTYTPVADASGTATVTVTLSDGVDTAAVQSFTITVVAANDAPSFTKGADQTVAEDSAAQSIANWATGISAGPADESAQTLTFTVTTTNNALFSAQPAISSSGLLTYTPAADASGSATVTVTLSDGIDTTVAQTFTITVTPVNDAPAFTKGADQTVAEDAAAQSIANWATGISAGPANEAAQTLTFTVTADNTGLFSAQPAISSSGILTYTPAANANGTATVTVTLSDGAGGTTPAQTFTISVAAVNDAPSFAKGADPSVAEDAGAQSIANWATNISAGPADEGAQTLSFTVTNNNNGLFSAQPAISSSGILTFTPAADANGTATVTVSLSDGVDTAATQTFTITVTPVNDLPSFTKGADQTILEDAGPQSVANWATGISAGPANEAAQTLTFAVTADNTGLFSAQPAISSSGILTYTPAANANGTATVTVTLSDGADTASAQTFTITVTPVNDAPSFTKGADPTILEDAGPQSVANWATGISAGPANEAAQTLTFTVTTNNNGLFSAQPAISSSGVLTYTPAANANGTATVTVTLSDGVDTAAGQTFTVNVTAVNDVPSFTKGANQTILEDAGPQSAANWATGISAGPADEAAQTLTFAVTTDNNALFSAQPAISSSGLLTYTPAANANGEATVTVTLSDGVDTTAVETFTIAVTAVNDLPAFTKGSDQTILEDAGPQSVANWATGISAGPADEAAQALTFTVTNSNNALFSAQPAISSSGLLTYTPAADANGTATVTVTLSDGADSTGAQIFTISVTAVNDAPVFTGAAANTAQTIAENAGLAQLAATDAEGDAPVFAIASGTLPAGITMNPDGTFTGVAGYQAAGTYELDLSVSDGQDSRAGHLTVTVTNADTTPTLAAIPAQTSSEGSLAQLTVTGADADGDSLTYSAAGLPSGLTMSPATGVISGSLSYSTSGSYQVTVTVTDATATAGNAAADQASRSFLWTVHDVNRSPRYTGPSTLGAAEGEGLSGLSAADDDGDAVTFALAGGALPEGIQLAADGSFSGTASYRSAGTYPVSVTVRDARGSTGSGQVTIVITPTDTAPTLRSVSDQTNTEGDQVSLSLTAQDTDGDSLTYRAQGLPPGISIDGATGIIAGTIERKAARLYQIEVSVTDNTPGGPGGDLARQTFAWRVNAKRGPKPIAGRVSNARTGAPVSGATVQIRDAAGATVARDVTGADGSFATGELPEGGYTVEIAARGFTVRQQTVTIGPDELPALDVSLAPLPTTVSGVVTDSAGGQGIAGVKVTLTQGQQTYTATTVEGGTFIFQDVPGGLPATISVADADYLEAAPAVIATEPGGTYTQNFSLQPRTSFTLSGPSESEKLELPPGVTGSYLPGQPVSIVVNGRVVATVTTGEAGTFAYDLSAVKDDLLFGLNFVTAQARTPAGRSRTSNTVSFNFSPAGSVSGVVTAETGAPLGGVAVHLRSALGKAGQSTTTAADGTFTFEQAPAGVYDLMAGPQEQPLATVSVSVTGGQRVERSIVIGQAKLALTATPAVLVGDGASATRLEAQLTLANGQPATGVTIEFSSTAGTISRVSAVTDSNGRAAATLTAPALDRVQLQQAEVRAAVAKNVSGLFAESSVTISFVPATITGVVMEGGKPVEGAKVSVAEDFNQDGVIDFTATVLTGPDGKYVIEVPRGNWVYKANVELPAKPGGVPLKTTQNSRVGALDQVGESIPATRAIGGQVLLGARTGAQPITVLPQGVKVEAALRDQSGSVLQGVQVQADGTYLVEGIPAGEYEIVVQMTAPDGQRLAGAVARTTVSESGALSLSSILIDPYGIVTDALTGEPIEGVKMRLMWADTPLNRAKNRTPHTEVQLPLLENFPPANNADPQWTDSRGNYAWMVFPDADYYLLGEKEGYLPYDSRKEGRHVPAAAGEDSFIEKGVIHVGQAIVHYDFSMQPLRGVHKAYVNGFPDGEFKPDRTLTRAEAATILARLLSPAGVTGSADPFTDVPATHWASRSIAATAALGLMKGDPDGRFRPDDVLTRAEIAVIIGRVKRLPALPGNAFPDTQGHWAEGAIKAAQTAGFMRGLPDGTFAPGRGVTRAEFVTVVNRALGRGPAPAGGAQIFRDVPPTHWATGQITEAAREHAFEMQPDGTESYVQP